MDNLVYEWRADSGRIYTNTQTSLTLSITNPGSAPVTVDKFSLELPTGIGHNALTNQTNTCTATAQQTSWDIRSEVARSEPVTSLVYVISATDMSGQLDPGTISFQFDLTVNDQPGTATLYMRAGSNPDADLITFPLGKWKPPVVSLNTSLSRTAVPLGETFRLNWNTTNAEYCKLKGRPDLPDGTRLPPNGSWEIQPWESTTYQLEALVCDQLPPATGSVSVRVGQPPTITKFEASPIRYYYSVSWSVAGENPQCVLTTPNGDKPVGPTGEVSQADRGETYTLRASNEFGPVVRSLTIRGY